MDDRNIAERSAALAQAALGRIRQTSLRVAQILDANRSTGRRRSWKPAVSLVGAFAIASVLCISRAPRLVAFHNSDASRPASSATAAVAAVEAPAAPFLAAAVRAKWVPARAKAAMLATRRKPAIPERIAVRRPAEPQSDRSLVHLTGMTADSPAFTETFLVVIGSPDPGAFDPPALRIQLWRVVVFHPAVDSDSGRIPPKQT